MKRHLVVLTCVALLLASATATSVVAQSNETTDTYGLSADGTVPLHDRQATIGSATTNVTSLVGLYPGQEALLEVTAPEDELAVVTVRTPDGTVQQKESVTTGESVLVDSTDYDPGTYYVVLSTGGQVRTVSLLVVSSYQVSYGLNNVTAESAAGDVTVAGGVGDGHAVQFVLSNEDGDFRTNASEVRRGLYEFDLSVGDVPDGEYAAVVEVVESAGANGSRTILATSQVRTVTVGEGGGDADEMTETSGEAASSDDGTTTETQVGDAAMGDGTATAENTATSGSNSSIPDRGPVVLFALLLSWAVVARVHR